MKKGILLLLIFLPVLAFADIVEIDGIYFNLITKAKVAEVKRSPDRRVKYIGDIIIPESVTYEGTNYNVNAIADSAFYECSGLNSINIPNCVTSVGNYSFNGCSALTSIIIPNSVTSIGISALWDCKKLTTISLGSGVKSIADGAIGNCESLTVINVDESNEEYKAVDNILYTKDGTNLIRYPAGRTASSFNIPSSVKIIEKYAFEQCNYLENIVIPDNVTNLKANAFLMCDGLTTVTLGRGLTVIEDCAFTFCSGLTSVTIPDKVKSIGNQSFYGCSKLSYVNIGSGVNTIKQYAFARCPELKEIFCHAENVPQTSKNTFEDSYINYATLYVPNSSVSNYKSSSPWSSFGSIISLEGYESSIEDIIHQTPIISNVGGQLIFDGIDAGININVYDTNGIRVASIISGKNPTFINTSLKTGSIAIIKMGNKSVKVLTK